MKQNENFFLLCEGHNDYFVSNIVHFFDMFNFLSNENTGSITSSNFENLYKSKRSTYYDCEGYVSASNKKKNIFIYQSQVKKNSDLKVFLKLSQKDNLLKIELNDKKIIIKNFKKNKAFYFDNTFQSKLTHKIVLDIFNNNCKLINFENYKFIQLQILKCVFKKFQISNKKRIRFT